MKVSELYREQRDMLEDDFDAADFLRNTSEAVAAVLEAVEEATCLDSASIARVDAALTTLKAVMLHSTGEPTETGEEE